MQTIKDALKWMFKTTFTVIAVFAVLIFFMLAFVAKMSFENIRHLTVVQDTYLKLSFPAGLYESPARGLDITSFRIADLGKPQLTFRDVLDRLSAAEGDNRIKGILLDLDNWNLSFEHTSEIISKLERLSEKNIIAYGSRIDKVRYFASLPADEIVIDPSNSSTIMLNGFSASIPYFGDLGDKAGIEVEVIHVGKYKGAGENYARNSMSEELRQSVDNIIGSRTELFAGAVSKFRHIDKNIVTEMLMNGNAVLITPGKAVELGLADSMKPFEQIMSENFISARQLLDISEYTGIVNSIEKAGNIAVIFAEGEIVDEQSPQGFGDGTIDPEMFGDIFKKIKKDSSIKAVVLRVNSPGGSALASEKILRNIIELKERMPVVVSMGAVAASGGYYISSHGTRIFAEPFTITGSVGVVSMIPDLSGLMTKIGINYQTVSGGKYSDMFDPGRKRTDEEISLIRNSMQLIYEEFKSRVSSGRNLEPDEVEKAAQGQIWTAQQAKDKGLIDELGGFEDALAEAASQAGLSDYGVVSFPENLTFPERILSMGEEGTGSELTGLFRDMGIDVRLIRQVLLLRGRPSFIMPLITD